MMTTKQPWALVQAMLAILVFSGCQSDKLVVFQQNLLSDNEMKQMLGEYEVVNHAKDFRDYADSTFKFSKQGVRYPLEGRIPNNDGKTVKLSGYFILSKIPNSKSHLILASSPRLQGYDENKPLKNFFAILKVDGRRLFAWLFIDSDAPVLDGRVEVKDGAFNSQQLLHFLETRADAYVLANPPSLTFVKRE